MSNNKFAFILYLFVMIIFNSYTLTPSHTLVNV